MFFNYNFSIDATYRHDCLGRSVNDASKSNTVMKKVILRGIPHLALFATQDIEIGDEITYDYGDGNNLWWRSKNQASKAFIRKKP